MTLMTEECYESLIDKLNHLRFEEQPKAAKMIEECRPLGTIEDNPEFMHALENMTVINKKITDLQYEINQAVIFKKSMINKDEISFGATVEIMNTDTNDVKKYTLLSRFDSDLDKNIISIEAPIAKSMMNLEVGDYFTFNDIEYEILSIYYACLAH